MQVETQKTIARWSTDTFGNTTALRTAVRMNVEVSELLSALTELDALERRYHRGDPRVSEADVEAQRARCAEECADVDIILVQVAERLGIDLQEARNAKMQVNRARNWTRIDAGRFQHT